MQLFGFVGEGLQEGGGLGEGFAGAGLAGGVGGLGQGLDVTGAGEMLAEGEAVFALGLGLMVLGQGRLDYLQRLGLAALLGDGPCDEYPTPPRIRRPFQRIQFRPAFDLTAANSMRERPAVSSAG